MPIIGPHTGAGSSTPVIATAGGADQSANMIFTVKTNNTGTSNSDQFTLALATGTTNFIVDWGDESTPDEITTYNAAALTHTFPGAGTYTVTIKPATGETKPVFSRIWFNGGGDCKKLTGITQWGTNVWQSMDKSFFNCTNSFTSATDRPDLSVCTSMENAFRLTGGGIYGHWDYSNVQNFKFAWLAANLSADEDFSNADFSSANAVESAFASNPLFNSILPAYPSTVTSLKGLLSSCSRYNRSVAHLITADITDITNMLFGVAASIASYDHDFVGANFTGVTAAAGFVQVANLKVWQYNALLELINSQAVQNSVTFGATNLSYSGSGATARAALISDHSWTFVGDTDISSTSPYGNIPANIRVVINCGQSQAAGTGTANASIFAAGNEAGIWNGSQLLQVKDAAPKAATIFQDAATGSYLPKFARDYADNGGDYVLILHCARGGSSMIEGVTDPSWSPTDDASLIDSAKAAYDAMLAHIANDLDLTVTVDSIEIIWYQATTDALTLTQSAFEDGLEAVIADFKSQFTGITTRFYIIEEEDACNVAVPATTTSRATARAAQAAVVAANSDVYWGSRSVVGGCVAGYFNDGNHFGQTLYEIVGADLADNIYAVTSV